VTHRHFGWDVLVGCSLVAQVVFNYAWMFEWWGDAQLVLGGMSLLVGGWCAFEHRPRWRGAVLASAVLAAGQWHLIRSLWMLVVWRVHGYRP
jgi:hypothetical protein